MKHWREIFINICIFDRVGVSIRAHVDHYTLSRKILNTNFDILHLADFLVFNE